MELVRGQVVQSRKGRDVTRWYMVVGTAGGGSAQRVLVANGRRWTLEAPKAKNPLHLQPTKTVLAPGQTDTNQKLEAALTAYAQARGPKPEGG